MGPDVENDLEKSSVSDSMDFSAIRIFSFFPSSCRQSDDRLISRKSLYSDNRLRGRKVHSLENQNNESYSESELWLVETGTVDQGTIAKDQDRCNNYNIKNSNGSYRNIVILLPLLKMIVMIIPIDIETIEETAAGGMTATATTMTTEETVAHDHHLEIEILNEIMIDLTDVTTATMITHPTTGEEIGTMM